jgi:hypothetical protein
MGSRFSIEAERDSLKAQVDAFKVRCDALTIQRDAAEALAREAQVSAWAIGVVAKACDEGQAAAIADRDAAEQMVAEMRLYLAGAELTFAADGRIHDAADLRQALALSAPIAGRWCLASERDEALAILRDAVKYADEDRMTTPGSTRLARCLDRARKLVGGGE